MAFNHLLPFCSKSKHRATTNLFSFQSSAGRPVRRRKMLPHPVQEHQPSEEMMSERELRGEKKPVEASQGGSGALDLLAALGGVDDSNKRPKKVRDSKGRKLAGGYPIP